MQISTVTPQCIYFFWSLPQITMGGKNRMYMYYAKQFCLESLFRVCIKKEMNHFDILDTFDYLDGTLREERIFRNRLDPFSLSMAISNLNESLVSERSVLYISLT